jgi:hypothetical protein
MSRGTSAERAWFKKYEPYAALVSKTAENAYVAESGITGEVLYGPAGDKNAVIQAAIDATESGIVWVKDIDPATVSYTKKSGVVVLFDYKGNLLSGYLNSYKVIRVPTNTGWSASNGGSGSVGLWAFYFQPFTGTTPDSRGMSFALLMGLNSGNIQRCFVDWTKRMELEFFVSRQGSDAEAIARFQLKEANTEGILAQRGIGIQISNYAMVGESYGTARGTVNLATLSDYKICRIKIVKTASAVEFWVNGVLTGTITTANAIPSVQGTANAYLVASIINGATGGVNADLCVGNIIITQEW